MNQIRFALAIALFASLAFSALLVAQDSGPPNVEPNKHHEATPADRKPEANPPRRQEEDNPSKHPETRLPESQPETKPSRTEKQQAPQPSKKEENKPGHEEHGTSVQQGKARPAGKGAHIPDPQFKAHFGKQHTFAVTRVLTTTTIVPNQTQFVYVGYTFIFLDPWPAEWLFTDECYIDYVDDEYFLFDVFHPGIRIALFVVG
jgi:outer membrane biosynthesis protein TonB